MGVNLRDIRQIDFTQFELFATVDTQPGTGNNSLPEQIEPDIVIDHHPCRPRTRHCRFTDIRSRYGACATILFEYMECAKIQPEMSLATGLLYAIRSDTQDLGRDTVRADIRGLTQLYSLANKRMLSEIQRGKVQRNYYQMLANGLKNAMIVDNAIITNLEYIENPDMIAEVADFLLRDDSTDWVMVCGFTQHKLVFSVRRSQEQLSADKVIRNLVARKGSGGGHPSYAGGQISIEDLDNSMVIELIKKLSARFVNLVTTNPAKSEFLIQS
jgi:nanoRNase/pAp phosphatase (c-di-AMP/oligoRNAs hydrolase)